jgi:hypothetical protein
VKTSLRRPVIALVVAWISSAVLACNKSRTPGDDGKATEPEAFSVPPSPETAPRPARPEPCRPTVQRAPPPVAATPEQLDERNRFSLALFRRALDNREKAFVLPASAVAAAYQAFKAGRLACHYRDVEHLRPTVFGLGTPPAAIPSGYALIEPREPPRGHSGPLPLLAREIFALEPGAPVRTALACAGGTFDGAHPALDAPRPEHGFAVAHARATSRGEAPSAERCFHDVEALGYETADYEIARVDDLFGEGTMALIVRPWTRAGASALAHLHLEDLAPAVRGAPPAHPRIYVRLPCLRASGARWLRDAVQTTRYALPEVCPFPYTDVLAAAELEIRRHVEPTMTLTPLSGEAPPLPEIGTGPGVIAVFDASAKRLDVLAYLPSLGAPGVPQHPTVGARYP